MFSFIENSRKCKTITAESKSVVTWGWEVSRRGDLKGARGPFNLGDEYVRYLNAGEGFMSTTYVKDYQII